MSVYQDDIRMLECTQDQSVLLRYATEHHNLGVRRVAICRVKDEEARAIFALRVENDFPSPGVIEVGPQREERTEGPFWSDLTQDMSDANRMRIVLARPEAGEVVIPQIKDQACLHKIALEGGAHDAPPDAVMSCANIRKNAASRMTDQALLVDVYKRSTLRMVREAAIGLIEDRAIVFAAAREEPDEIVRSAAALWFIHRWAEDDNVAELLRTERSSALRQTISRSHRFRDQALLIDMLQTERDMKTLTQLAQQVEDEGALVSFLDKDSNPTACFAAITRIKDQAILSRVAHASKSSWVRIQALRRIKKRAIVAWIAKNDRDRTVRLEAEIHLRSLT